MYVDVYDFVVVGIIVMCEVVVEVGWLCGCGGSCFGIVVDVV